MFATGRGPTYSGPRFGRARNFLAPEDEIFTFDLHPHQFWSILPSSLNLRTTCILVLRPVLKILFTIFWNIVSRACTLILVDLYLKLFKWFVKYRCNRNVLASHQFFEIKIFLDKFRARPKFFGLLQTLFTCISDFNLAQNEKIFVILTSKKESSFQN